MLPSQLGHYRLLEKLGEGGMGVVYKAIDTHLDRPVALKILPQDKVADSERKRRFVQEAKAASALNHPNIVTIHDIGADQGVDFLVMEFIEGKTLDQLIPRQGMRLPEMLRIAAQIAEGLTAAHGAGITHRDLKPSNIMVSNAGHVKILDFGLAKLTDRVEVSEHDRTLTEAPATTEGAIMGTICYMSPEQAEGKKVDARSDIFSFGAVLYEMASGQRAFRGDTPASTLGAVIHKDPKPLTELAPVVPHDLDKLVARCLRKDRDRRFQGMADLRVALLDLKEESDTGRLTATATAASPSRSTWQVAAAGAGALILGAAATLFWINRSHSAAVASEPVLTQITRDAGMTSDPALSPDGKLLAYSSDRADGRNMDIWVQQMAGGQPVRLTRHTAVDTNPQFSADGTTIYFYSPRAEGTVWAIPALGGDERVLSKEKAARAFVLSPDGRWIAQGRPGGAGEASPAFLLATASGVLRKVETTVQTFIPVTWSTDSSMLIGWGKDDVISLATSSEYRLYAVPAEGGKAIPFEGKTGTTSPSAARLQGNRLFAVINSAIEEFSVSPGWKIEGPVRRWASFPGAGLAFTVSGGAMVAATVTSSTDIWSVPIDANRGKVKGLPERVTNDDASETAPSLSADGSKLVFTSNRHGNRDVWLREMATGKETQVTATADTERRARISPDGSSIAYEVRSKPPAIFMRELGGGEPKPACADCSLPGWSPDSGRVVYFQGKPIQFHTFDVATGQRTVLVAHPTASVQTANLSPDGRWVSFHIPGGGSRNQIWIAPVREGTAAPRAEWIAITENDARYHHAWWSPGGSLLYFLGDSYSRVFARELDPSSKRPRGEPFAVFEPGPGLRLSHPEAVGLSLTRDRLVLTMVQSKSNLWKIE